MKRILVALVLLISLQGATALAAPAAPQPDPGKNPILAALQKMGAKFFYLGNRSGMDGWFIVKDGQVQIAYATPDNKNTIIGAMFGQDGENITALQVSTLLQTDKDFAAMMTQIQKEQANLAVANATGSGTPTAPPASKMGGMPATPLSPGEKLMQDLGSASTVIAGKPSSPEILMVMDTRCPHCQAAFTALHDRLARGDLHLRLIPIGAADSENERTGANLLASSDALATWTKYIAGDASVLAGTPSLATMEGMRANHKLIDQWKIQYTPYLVYRGKDGKVKIVQGEPNIPAVLKDLGL